MSDIRQRRSDRYRALAFRPGGSRNSGRALMIEEIASHVRRGESFAFETTLSGRRYGALIPAWQRHGHEVILIFLYLPSVEIAIERVRERVRQGGHNVPEEVIRRRFESGWKNFKLFSKLVDYWHLYDNSGEIPMLLSEGQKL
jgi:predicted ABC-type ATPase